MLAAFIAGLLIVLKAIVVTIVVVLCAKWLIEYVKKKLKGKEKHKVAFADTREVVDEYLKDKANRTDEISMDELERMCESSPYVAALVDEEGEISEYEGFEAEKYNENFIARLKQQKGMIVVEA